MRPPEARVLLTGATGGIGRAMAAHLLAEGAAVMLLGRSASRLAALGAELTGPPGSAARITWHVADLDDGSCLESIRGAAASWGVNVLVNNAGVSGFGRFADVPPRQMAQVLMTNLLAPMRLTHALLPLLISRPRAQVIQVGSALGRLALPGFSVYCASKFGLRGFTEALRRELADTPVRVQYLGPRTTRTSFNDAAATQFNEATGAAVDTPDDVAKALLSLLTSEKAEHFVGFPEALAGRLNGFAPALLDGAFAKHRRSLNAGPTVRSQHPAPTEQDH